jgi:hypothetical protein
MFYKISNQTKWTNSFQFNEKETSTSIINELWKNKIKLVIELGENLFLNVWIERYFLCCLYSWKHFAEDKIKLSSSCKQKCKSYFILLKVIKSPDNYCRYA